MKIELYRGDPYTPLSRHSERAKKQNLTSADAVGLDPDSERKKRQQELKEQHSKTKDQSEDEGAPHAPATTAEQGYSEAGHLDVVV